MRRRGVGLLAGAATLVAGLVVPAAPAVANVVANTAPTSYTGDGFDIYTAQPTSTLRAWLSSSKRAVNVYVGGVNRYDRVQPNLDAAWVSTVTSNGWRLIPTYVGLQAPCTTSNKRYRITPSEAAAQGRGNAYDAIRRMKALGMGPGNPVYLDMEPFDETNAACAKAVSTFFDGWTYRLHRGGYLSGIYGHWKSTVPLLVKQYYSRAHLRPDDIWWARYDGRDSTSTSLIPASYWPHHRIHQYGNVDESHNGVTLNIDRDAVDADTAGVTPPTPPSGPPYHYQASGTQGSASGGLNVRSTPSTSGTALRVVPEGGDLPVVCQTTGDAVEGDRVWDQLDPNAGGGYVSDLYTTTAGGLAWAGAVPRCDGMPAGHLAAPANGVTLEAGRPAEVAGWFSAAAGVASVTFQASSDGGRAWSDVGVDTQGDGTGRYAVAWPPAWTAGSRVAVRATVTDTVGNVATTRPVTGIHVVDTTAPTVRVHALPVATLARVVRVSWTGVDAGAGIGSYDVRWQRARFSGGFGAWRHPTAWTGTTATATWLRVAPGYDYCFAVRARDRVGNLSHWSRRRCVARALDDRSLSAGAGWSRGSGTGFYLDTVTTTRSQGRHLLLTGARLVRVGVVATTCARCGTVAVYVAGHWVGRLSLYAPRPHRQQVLLLPRFPYRAGRVVLRTSTAGRVVQIDGLVVSRT